MSSRVRSSGWVLSLTLWALAGMTMSGCASSPPLQANGLPRYTRYTNTIQLDWLLGQYRASVERAMQNAQVLDLLEEACLGYERVLFDIESSRRYPGILRMSTDGANLAALQDQFPEIVSRHPRPAACASIYEGTTAANETGTLAKFAEGVAPPPFQPSPPVASPAPEPSSTDMPTASDGATQAAPQPTAEAPLAPPPVAPMVDPAVPLTESAKERRLLARLRTALHMGYEDIRTDSPPADANEAVDLATLNELAQSDLVRVRLRARYHLLGQCALAVENADRDWIGRPSGLPPVTDGAAQCSGRAPRETLRMAQRRLSRSMLQAWAGRYVEPMSEIVVALANFVSRDNPMLDGPRLAR